MDGMLLDLFELTLISMSMSVDEENEDDMSKKAEVSSISRVSGSFLQNKEAGS